MNSLHRALAILNFIRSREQPVSPKEIATELAIPLSTVYRLLHILKTWEMITYAQQQGTYTLGAHSLHIANRYARQSLAVKQLRPLAAQLAKECRETVALLVATPQESICIDIIEAERTLRCSFEIGKGNSLVRGASGKAFLAFCTESFREAALATPSQQLDADAHNQLLKELADIRQQGFATSVGEIDEGVFGVSAPVFLRRELLAVLTIMAPAFRAVAQQTLLAAQVCASAAAMTAWLNDE